MKEEKVSPLKEKPLRQAGQGAREMLTDYALDNLFYIVFVVGITLFICAMEWIRYFFPQPPHPLIYTFVFILTLIWAVLRWSKSIKNINRMRQGRDGEIIVGQTLDELTVNGFHVFHDVPARSKKGKRFNIDHVLVGKRGIFAVETKTWSKHSNGTDKIEADSRGILIAGYIPDKDILLQPLLEADWISEMINHKIGKNIKIKPVLTFPGWFIEPSAQKVANERGVLLVNPKALGKFIMNESETFSSDEVSILISLISSHVRDFVEED